MLQCSTLLQYFPKLVTLRLDGFSMGEVITSSPSSPTITSPPFQHHHQQQQRQNKPTMNITITGIQSFINILHHQLSSRLQILELHRSWPEGSTSKAAHSYYCEGRIAFWEGVSGLPKAFWNLHTLKIVMEKVATQHHELEHIAMALAAMPYLLHLHIERSVYVGKRHGEELLSRPSYHSFHARSPPAYTFKTIISLSSCFFVYLPTVSSSRP